MQCLPDGEEAVDVDMVQPKDRIKGGVVDLQIGPVSLCIHNRWGRACAFCSGENHPCMHPHGSHEGR